MPFIADPAALRTIDADREIELVTDGASSDGPTRFKLIRSDGAEVRFFTCWEPEEQEQWRRNHPSAINPFVHFVGAWRGIFPGQTRIETDEVIREALMAFKGVHGVPVNNDLFVEFR